MFARLKSKETVSVDSDQNKNFLGRHLELVN
jgi:hypothetical protein